MPYSKAPFKLLLFMYTVVLTASQTICFIASVDLIMGCIKSKENKSPAIKYRTENTPEPVSTSASHYGVDLSPGAPAAAKGASTDFSNLSITPFGGSSGVTPFGGASSSFSVVPSSYPAGITGEMAMTSHVVWE